MLNPKNDCSHYKAELESHLCTAKITKASTGLTGGEHRKYEQQTGLRVMQGEEMDKENSRADGTICLVLC